MPKHSKKKRQGTALSGYRIVWIFVLFDLPTTSPEERRDYTVFRKKLLADGFTMMQYSVYVRHCPSEENADVHVKRTKAILPPEGEVRVLQITDKQFGRMQIFLGKIRKEPEKAGEQLTLF